MSKLAEALKPKARVAKGEKDSQYNGIKLQKDYVEELYKMVKFDLGVPGSAVLDAMIADLTGEEIPEESVVATDGSKFIGKKMSIKAPDAEATVFDNHVKLCEALGIPATTTGADTFRVVLQKYLEKHDAM